MSEQVSLEERSSKSKASKQSKKSSQKQESASNNNNNEKNSNAIGNSSQPVLSTRAYLEQNVVPVVQEALLECARNRPNNPLEFVGNYILERAHGK